MWLWVTTTTVKILTCPISIILPRPQGLEASHPRRTPPLLLLPLLGMHHHPQSHPGLKLSHNLLALLWLTGPLPTSQEIQKMLPSYYLSGQYLAFGPHAHLYSTTESKDASCLGGVLTLGRNGSFISCLRTCKRGGARRPGCSKAGCTGRRVKLFWC